MQEPLNHCALNVALYTKDRNRWAMTERPRRAVQLSETSLAIGPSSLFWNGEALTFQINEITSPFPSRIRGTVRLYPAAVTNEVTCLDINGLHRWRSIAPCSHVEVDLEHPSLKWSGAGYLDSNDGDAPLENTFESWNWSRASLHNHDTAVLYDVLNRDGTRLSLGRRFDSKGGIQDFPVPAAVRMTDSAWRLARETNTDKLPAVLRSLEDGPFYSRSVISSHLLDEPVTAIHESLNLDRFRSPWVQMLLPFRMPRALR